MNPESNLRRDASSLLIEAYSPPDTSSQNLNYGGNCSRIHFNLKRALALSVSSPPNRVFLELSGIKRALQVFIWEPSNIKQLKLPGFGGKIKRKILSPCPGTFRKLLNRVRNGCTVSQSIVLFWCYKTQIPPNGNVTILQSFILFCILFILFYLKF